MIKSIQQACRRWSKLLVTGLVILVIAFSLIPIHQPALAQVGVPTPEPPSEGKELIDQRTANSKTFDLGGGKRGLDVSIADIHYKDDYSNPDELWKDIDLTWDGEHLTTAPYELTVKGNVATVRDKKTDEVSVVELLGCSFSKSDVSDPRYEIIPENTRVYFRYTLDASQLPFEVHFRIEGKIPLISRAFDDMGELELETSWDGNILIERITEVKDKDTGELRTPSGEIKVDPTLDLQVGASANDCEAYYNRSIGSWSFSTARVILRVGCEDPDPSYGLLKYGGGMRFTGVTVPKGSTITSAYLTITARDTTSATTVRSKIRGQASDNAAQFSTYADYSSRPRTSATVYWDNIPAWTANVQYNSPSITSIIQEIVNRSGWSSGNSLVIFWDDHDNRSSQALHRYRGGYSYDGNSGKAPKLHIGYTVPCSPNISLNTYSWSINSGNPVPPSSSYSTGLTYFTITNNSGGAVDITIHGTDMTGGGYTWTLSDSGSPSDMVYALKAGLSGGDYTIVVKKTTPYNTLVTGLADSATQSFGLKIWIPTAFSDGNAKTGTITLTAACL